MNRRRVLLVLLGLGPILLGARESGVQPAPKPPLIGLLDAGERLEWWAEFRQQLRDLGYVEGKNIAIEARFASGRFDKLPALAQELVGLRVAVIVTAGSVATQAAKRATSTIPIVIASGGGGLGLVASLARPQDNVTGVINTTVGLIGKRFELLTEVIPKISRLAVLWDRDNPGSEESVRELEAIARSSKVALQILGVKTADEFTGAFSTMAKERAAAVFVIADPYFFSERRRIADLAKNHRLPSIHGLSEYVEAGGLLSYGASSLDLFRRSAVYVDKILRGARPSDLPIEQPTKFELVVNLKTARALGVTIPRSVLLRTDRVIE
jgi:putative ABC transport system substrate-binding protein